MTLYLNMRGEPSRHGAVVDLPPKERAVLALLIERHPGAVSKEDLIAYAWGDRQGAVSDDSVVRCVRQIRRALPNVGIESVYGFGYRLKPSEAVVHGRILQAANAPPPLVESYLHALQLAQQRTPTAMARALELFRDLCRRYPDYAPARIALAQNIGAVVGLGMDELAGVELAEAWEQLETVHRTHPQAAGLKLTQAWLSDLAWRFDEAERLYQQSLQSDPDAGDALHLYAWHLIAAGQGEHAVSAVRRVLAQRRYAAYTRVSLALTLSHVGRGDEALHEIAAADREHPGNLMVACAATTLRAMFAPDARLIKTARRLSALAEMPPYCRVSLPWVMARCGAVDAAREEARALLGDARLSVSNKVLLASALIALGELDRAADLVVAAHEARYGWLPFVLRAPRYAPLLRHPRVQAVFSSVFASLPR